MAAFGFGFRAARRRPRLASGVPPVLSAVAADGWQATAPGVGELSLLAVPVARAGFTAAGAATTVLETLQLTKRVRRPYPDHASFTADRIAFSDYVYATDTIAGVTNSSAETSPKPVANWIMPHRETVGNSLTVECVAFHRNARAGKQVACVVFRATDGTNTVTATVATPAGSGRTGDRNAVISHKTTIDITSLNAGLITVNAKVHPWIGGSGSVLDSADQSGGREFSPRYFLKNTGLAASPFYAYVKTGGSSGGVFSTSAATAEATPFDTVVNMMTAINGGAAGKADNVIVRFGNDGGTPWVMSGPASARTQNVGALIFTRDPAVARANARVSFGAAAFRPRLAGSITAPLTTGALLFRDIAIVRSGTATLQGEAANQLEVMFDDVDFDNGSNNATWLNQSHDYHFGTAFTNLTGTTALGAGTYEHRILRGVSLDPNFGGMEGWLIVGSAFTRPGQMQRGTRTFSGAIHAFNKYLNPLSSGSTLDVAADQDVTGFVFAQNLVEWTSATTNPFIRISGDATTGNNSHVILHQNTFAGAFQAGRWNAFYDDGATRRTSKLQSVVGNIAVAVYTKSDVFRGQSEGDGSGAATGNWAFSHGVGVRGNFHQFRSQDAVGTGQAQAPEYGGVGTVDGTSQTTRNDPVFTSYAGTTVSAGPSYSAGAGGGDYTLQGGSAARGIVADPVLNYGLSGAARPSSNDAAGAYG